MSEVKRYTRIVTDAAGGSTFQDNEFPLEALPSATGMLTGTVPAASAVVYVRHDTWDNFARPVPRPAPRRWSRCSGSRGQEAAPHSWVSHSFRSCL
jgi:hypothetical protein